MRIAIVHYSRSISYVGRKHRLPNSTYYIMIYGFGAGHLSSPCVLRGAFLRAACGHGGTKQGDAATGAGP